MSRAFVKDGDDRPEQPLPRPVGEGPNYVTATGLQRLQEALVRARAAQDRRNEEYFEERLADAIVVDPAAGPAGVVAFGCVVVAHDERGAQTRLRIVGEDEADPVHGTVSWASPYAQALLDHRAGDRVVVQRPTGPVTLVIDSVETAG